MQEEKLPLLAWIREGLRAGFLCRPRTGRAQPTAWQLLVLLAGAAALELLLGRFEIAGDADFDLRGWLTPWWNTGALLLAGWWALPRDDEGEGPRGLAAWFALWVVGIVPANTVSQLLSIAQVEEVLPDWVSAPVSSWALYIGLWAWTLAVAARIAISFHVPLRRTAALVAVFAAVFAITASQFPDRAWKEDAAQRADEGPPRMALTQEVFEAQQALLQQALDGLQPQRPDMVDVYGIVFSPYASEDVFLNESGMVTKVLQERFDAAGRVVQLVNHATTAESLPWATQTNLERAALAVGQRMDRDKDVLVVYLTSHGAGDFRLAAANPPLEVDTVSPGELRQALDHAGIRNRVIVVSACYSGGWVGPLADEHTLVMTASDATHTSYGCGRGSELTYFGRAVFDEQLRRTHSFEQAFAAAVPIIRQREVEGRKPDGFSNPQISVGEQLRPVLRELEQRLDREVGK